MSPGRVGVQSAIRDGTRRLPQRLGIPDPHREAAWLLAAAWGRSEVWLQIHPEADVPGPVMARYQDWLRRRAAGEPAHHLTGWCPFWGRDFRVTPATLIPRPETELVVATALDLPLPESARVLDVGTGSGCIGISLAAERPQWQVFAVDRYLPALVIARENACRQQVALTMWQGHLLSALAIRADLVVANLPYIPADEISRLPQEVRHDPRSALDGGADGLDLVSGLLRDLPRLLASDGMALFELGPGQADAVARVADGLGLAELRRIPDLGNCDRVMVLGRRQRETIRRQA